MKVIIEHLDPQVHDWSLLEYKHISLIWGVDNVIFTNVKKDAKKLEGLGEIHKDSITDAAFRKKLGVTKENAIVLDPFAEKVFETKDCKDFSFLILGGVLGNHPPDKRTKRDITDVLKAQARNMGEEQMSTDTAAYVAKKIADGKKLSEMRFAYMLEVETGENESMELPYRYVIENGKPVLAPGFIEFISEWDGF